MAEGRETLDGLDRYDLGEVVYVGPNSVVHRGRRRADDAPVFIKRHRSVRPSPAEVSRMRRDFALGRRVQGDGAVRYLELVRDGAGLAVVTEDTGSGALALLLTPGRGLDVATALRVGAAIARALAAVHARGVMHGDLKPLNVVADLRGDDARLVDFGAASTLSRVNERVAPAEGFGGTLAYVAPEQTGRMNRAVDARADLYALGVTLFELLTGALPFPDADPLALLHAHLARVPPRVDLAAPGVDAVVGDIVARLLAKDPDDRYHTAAGVADDLARCVRALRDGGSIAPFALGAADLDTRLVLSQRLYGREVEVAALTARLDALAQGASAFALVAGAPGIGKSALLDELERPALLRGAWFVRGRFEQFRRDLPLAAFGEALRALLRALDEAPPERAARVREALRTRLRQDAHALFPIAPELGALVPDAAPPDEAVGVEASRARLVAAMRGVLGAFGEGGAGTVLVIDDLQWADESSHQLLRALAEDAPHTLILGAFREGEVDDGHPLSAAVRAIEARTGVAVPRLLLGPLREGDVAALLADALRAPREVVAPLAATVHARAAGNPFFVRRLVLDLHAQGAIRFDAAAARWSWDLAAVDALDLPESVVALLRARMGPLPPAALEALQVASCLGAEESVAALAAVCGVEEDALRGVLDASIDEGFVRLVAGGARYRFVHDRVQQAAWESVLEGSRAAMHGRVGRVLLGALDGDDDPRVVSVAAHLDEAGDLGDDPPPPRLVSLGLAAARRAVAASAFDRAAGFTTRVRLRMGPGAWRDAPETALEAATLHARCLRALADHDGLAALVREVEAAQPDPLRLAPIYTEQLRDLAYLRDPREALAAGRRVLARFGVGLPENPTATSLLPGLARLRLGLLRRVPARVEDLSAEADPRALVEMELLYALQERAWVVSPMHGVASFVEIALRASRCGRTALAGFGWTIAGMAIMAVFNDAALAERLGILGRELLARGHRRDLLGAGSFAYLVVVAPWRHDLERTLEPLAESWRAARDGGDAHNEAQIPEVILFTRCFLGHDCAALRAEGEALLPRVRHDPPVHVCVSYLVQYLRCLQGDAPEPARLAGDVFDLDVELPREKDQNTRFGILFHDLVLAVHLGDAARKAASLGAVLPNVAGARDTFMRAMYPLYASLAAIDAEPLTPRRRAWLRVRLRLWLRDLEAAEALHPPNTAHRTALLRAEIARVEGRHLDALGAYEAAARQAQERGWHHEAGLAHERAARFHLQREEQSAARAHLEDALYHYALWGARAKIDALRAEFPRMLPLGGGGPSASATASATASGSATGESLDVLSVTRAAQALSGVIERSALVLRLLELTAENAGARRGALVTLRDGEAWVEAAFEVRDDDRSVRAVERRLGDSDEAPRGVVAAVLATRAPVRVDDAQAPDARGVDAALRARGTRSLLAVPLLRQGEVTGAMVLEHDLAAGAFTPARVSVVAVLASQAAISLENARLYADLQRALAEQVALTEANRRFVPQEFIASLGRTSIASVALGDSVQKEMTVLFSDMRGFSALVEGHAPEENIAFINEYLAAMEPAIVRHRGFVDSYIGDAILALFEGAPGDAVAAGVEMLRRLGDYNAARAQRGERPVRIGIGVNTGTLTLGTIGGPQRIKCGVIGDPVNLGARIETATKQYGVPFLVGEESVAGLDGRFALREVDRVKVRGRVRPVTLYEVFDADPEPARDAKRAALPAWREALDAWRGGDLGAADAAFARCARWIPDDPVLALRRARCARALDAPRAEPWTDVVALTEK